MAVAGKGEGAPAKTLERFAREFDAAAKLSPEESAFLQLPSSTDQDRARFSWRYEALYPVLWALGFFEALPPPADSIDPAKLGGVLLSRGAKRFRAEARLRSPCEILDEADLIYRYHWATRNAQLHGQQSPAHLNNDVIMERHQALNWLIGCGELDWDDVSTDT